MTPGVLIVCEHASARFGGEAVLPWHYFRLLRQKGIDAHLVTHSRTRDELVQLLPAEADRMHFMRDSALNKLCWRLGSLLPAQLSYFTFGYVSRIATQLAARRMARQIIARHGLHVVHQPIPVSPREPSLLFGLGVPVVIGPMNGNMSYPPAFSHSGRLKVLERMVGLGRAASQFMNRLSPGKLRAAALLVANERTRLALPRGTTGRILLLPENGVDLQTWFPREQSSATAVPTRFVFSGRLVDWKAVDLLLEAFATLSGDSSLDIIGDGPQRDPLQAQVQALGMAGRVRFHGWLAQPQAAEILRGSDVLVLSSLYECGGAVVLEAMATGLPVIATAWGGPADYLDAECGILVPPDSRDGLIRGLAAAMQQLASDPALRRRMGEAGRRKAATDYDWNAKVEKVLQLYREVIAYPRP